MEPDQVVLGIIQAYMGRDVDHIWRKNQNVEAPKDDGIFIVVGTGESRFVGAKSEFNHDTLEAVQYTTMNTTIDIDICSRSREALERKEEVIMSLAAVPGQMAMESNNMKSSRVQAILDISAVEGSSALHRYRTGVIIDHMKSVSKSGSEYFDQFRETEVSSDD